MAFTRHFKPATAMIMVRLMMTMMMMMMMMLREYGEDARSDCKRLPLLDLCANAARTFCCNACGFHGCMFNFDSHLGAAAVSRHAHTAAGPVRKVMCSHASFIFSLGCGTADGLPGQRGNASEETLL